jgi:hypothetical protein
MACATQGRSLSRILFIDVINHAVRAIKLAERSSLSLSRMFLAQARLAGAVDRRTRAGPIGLLSRFPSRLHYSIPPLALVRAISFNPGIPFSRAGVNSFPSSLSSRVSPHPDLSHLSLLPFPLRTPKTLLPDAVREEEKDR